MGAPGLDFETWNRNRHNRPIQRIKSFNHLVTEVKRKAGRDGAVSLSALIPRVVRPQLREFLLLCIRQNGVLIPLRV